MPPYQENRTAKMWLWIGVSVFTAIILVLWGWAISIRLSSFSWDKTPEGKLVQTSKTDWNTLFNNEETRIKNEQLKLQLKNLLNKITTETGSPTSTTSSTSTTTTSP